MERLKSRKFWMAVVACLAFAALAATGNMPLEESLNKISLTVLVYLGAQGFADRR